MEFKKNVKERWLFLYFCNNHYGSMLLNFYPCSRFTSPAVMVQSEMSDSVSKTQSPSQQSVDQQVLSTTGEREA